MKIDQALLQLAVVFLPGIVWAALEQKYVLRGKPVAIWFALKVFVFGMLSYAALLATYLIAARNSPLLNPGNDRLEFLQRVTVTDVVLATLVSLPLALAWLYISNHRLITRFLQAIGATNMYGDEDVWDYLFNSRNRFIVEYVHVRDFEKELVYSGWVELFSETDRVRELYLRDVEVAGFDGTFLYQMPSVYMARTPEDVTIEFPRQRATGGPNA